jgi:hypothetical protein
MSLIPASKNFTIYEGSTFYTRIFYEVEDVLQPLTGYLAELIIKDEPDGEVLLTLKSLENQGIVIDDEEATIDITIEANETTELDWTTGVYHLFLTNDEGRTDLILRGGFKISTF